MKNKIFEEISKISLNQVSDYLSMSNWARLSEYDNKKIKCYMKDNFTVALPRNAEFADFLPRMYELFDSVSAVDRISMGSLISSINRSNIDKISIRFVSESTSNGTIRVSYAANILNAIRDFIISSACTEENPRPFYNKVTAKAQSYADHFKFAQTEYGSYVMNIESSSSIQNESQYTLSDEGIQEELFIPFEKRIINRMKTSIKQIQDFSQYENMVNFIDEAYYSGLNANICDALLELRDPDEPVTIEAKFAINDVSSESNEIETITINNKSFHFIKAVAEAYRDNTDTEEITISGLINSVRHDSKNEETKGGLVSISFEYDNNERNVTTYLENEFYDIACDALKSVDNIEISGILDKSKIRWHLDDVTSIELLK